MRKVVQYLDSGQPVLPDLSPSYASYGTMALAQIQQGFDSYVMSRDPSSATTSVCAASSIVLSQGR
jgi:hypothetical protein